MPKAQIPSTGNTALQQLRDTARVLRKPQATVARNWLNTPAMTKYRPGAGITRQQFNEAQALMRRLAAVAQ